MVRSENQLIHPNQLIAIVVSALSCFLPNRLWSCVTICYLVLFVLVMSSESGMSIESGSETECYDNSVSNELQFIADEIVRAPVILEKSQIPKIKARKDQAIGAVIKKYEATYGKPLDTKGFLKKMNNMKTRLKKKTDLKRTGNKKIKLLDWERKLLKAMEGESNPTVVQIPGAMQVGVIENRQTGIQPGVIGNSNDLLSMGSTSCTKQTDKVNVTASQAILPKKRKLATEKYEMEETRGLTTKELQRLVLLQQYRTSMIQKQYYEKKLEIMKRQDNYKENNPKTFIDGNKTYLSL